MNNRLMVAIVVCNVIFLGFVAIGGYLFFSGGFIGAEQELNVSPVDEDEIEGDVVDYEGMTEAQQEVFREALRSGRETIPNDVNHEIWVENRGVVYENETYRVDVSGP